MRDAKLMGRLTASATHEMQNILATIRESGGLMSDILAMAGGGFAYAERFKKCLAVMDGQVERGMHLSENLNYCAHAPEPAAKGAEVNEAARALVGLSERPAARCRVGLVFSPGRAGLRTSLRPVEVMALLSLAIDCALPLMPQKGTLEVAVAEREGAAVLRLLGPASAALLGADCYADLEAEARSLEVGLAPEAGGGGLEFVLPRPEE